MAAALGAAGSFLSGSAQARQQALDNKRQAELDRQNAAINAAYLQQMQQQNVPVTMPPIVGTGKWPGHAAGAKTTPGGQPAKQTTNLPFKTLEHMQVVAKRPDNMVTIDDEITAYTQLLANSIAANRGDMAQIATTMLSKLQQDKIQQNWHEETMAQAQQRIASTVAAHSETARHNRWNEAHPRPVGGLNVTMGNKPNESNVYQFMSPQAQNLVDSLQRKGVPAAVAQTAVAHSALSEYDKRLAGAYVSSPDYKGVKSTIDVAWFTPIKTALDKVLFPAGVIAQMETAIRKGTLTEDQMLAGFQQAAGDEDYAARLGITSAMARSAYKLLTGQNP